MVWAAPTQETDREWRWPPAGSLLSNEVFTFIVDVIALKRIHALRYVLNVHPPADLPPVVVLGQLLLLNHRPPTKAADPANRFKSECGQYVKKVLVRDLKAPVYLIESTNRCAAALAVVPMLKHLAQDQCGVVISLLGSTCELACAIQQPSNIRCGECTEERKF